MLFLYLVIPMLIVHFFSIWPLIPYYYWFLRLFYSFHWQNKWFCIMMYNALNIQLFLSSFVPNVFKIFVIYCPLYNRCTFFSNWNYYIIDSAFLWPIGCLNWRSFLISGRSYTTFIFFRFFTIFFYISKTYSISPLNWFSTHCSTTPVKLFFSYFPTVIQNVDFMATSFNKYTCSEFFVESVVWISLDFSSIWFILFLIFYNFLSSLWSILFSIFFNISFKDTKKF